MANEMNVAQLWLEDCEVNFSENRDRMELLRAIRLCATHGLVMPSWLSREIIEGYARALTFNAATWDEAFGSLRPKDFKYSLYKKKHDLRWTVLQEVEIANLHDEPFTPIGEAMWETVGARLRERGIKIKDAMVKELWNGKDEMSTWYRKELKRKKLQKRLNTK